MINTPLQLDEWYKDNISWCIVKVKLFLKKNFTYTIWKLCTERSFQNLKYIDRVFKFEFL